MGQDSFEVCPSIVDTRQNIFWERGRVLWMITSQLHYAGNILYPVDYWE